MAIQECKDVYFEDVQRAGTTRRYLIQWKKLRYTGKQDADIIASVWDENGLIKSAPGFDANDAYVLISGITSGQVVEIKNTVTLDNGSVDIGIIQITGI